VNGSFCGCVIKKGRKIEWKEPYNYEKGGREAGGWGIRRSGEKLLTANGRVGEKKRDG